MRQRFPPRGSPPARRPLGRLQPTAPSSLPAPSPHRFQVFRERLRRLRDRSRGALLVGLGILMALSAFLVYDALHATSPRLTERDVESITARVMASATPPPSLASRVYDAIAPSIVQIRASLPGADGKADQVSGAGVIVDQAGTILTSLHIVKGASELKVVFFDNTEAGASIAAQDANQDIAVLLPEQLPSVVIPATMGSPGALNVGDDVFTVGNPFGLRHSLTAGVVSALGRNVKSPKTGTAMSNLIQFDAAVNPGNSGGPLLNRNGEVVGIVSMLLNPTDQEVFIGIGFAVPIETAGGVGGPPPF